MLSPLLTSPWCNFWRTNKRSRLDFATNPAAAGTCHKEVERSRQLQYFAAKLKAHSSLALLPSDC
jgi:hypothetical protein